MAKMTTTHTDRFSQPARDALRHHEDELTDFAARITHILNVEHELARVSRGKPFLPYHLPMWRMLFSEVDMVIVDLASWALHLYKKGDGGFLRSLQGSD